MISGVKSGVISGVNREVARTRANGREAAGQAASGVGMPGTRLPKDASVLRSRSRSAGDELRYSLARHLTDRDRALVRAIARHRVFTAQQLTEMFFASYKKAAERLLELVGLRVLDRFRPNTPTRGGSRPYHYVLGPLGAAVEAADRGEDADRAARRWKGERTLALGRTQRLAHLVGVNGFYAALVGHTRRDPDCALLDWLTEGEATRWTDGIVRPDAFGHWREDGRAFDFFLEYDRGTETLGRLVDKLAGYERFERERGASSFVLFAFVSERRERAARRALADATVPLATATLVPGSHPADAVWLPLAHQDARLRLAALAGVPKSLAAQERAAAGSLRAWRYDRSRPDDDEEEAPIETP